MPKPKAPPRGRPPIAAEDRRQTLVKVLVTAVEDQELRQAATEAGLTVSTWVRLAALEKARRPSGQRETENRRDSG